MSIQKIGSDLVRPFGPQGPRGDGSQNRGEAGESVGGDRADRVDISSAGRELAAQLVDRGGGLSPGRFEEIRARIEGGVYDDASIAEEVASRLFESGDLEIDA